MATFNSSRLYDQKVTCPYNSAHVLTKLTIGKHLVRCEKRHPEIVLKKCPFNVTHRIKPSAMAQHLQECEDRDLVESQLIEHRDPNRIKGSLAVPAYNTAPQAAEDGENWDDEISNVAAPSFDPSLNLNKHVKFFDVTKHTSKSKKERMAMYNQLHTMKSDGKTALGPLQPVVPDPVNASAPVNSNPTEIRRPNQEALAEKINNPYIGLGRGSANRCAANIGLYDSQPKQPSGPSPIFKSLNEMQGVTSSTSNKKLVLGRGRSQLNAYNSQLRDNAVKKVSVPPGFKKLTNYENDNEPIDSSNELQPLPEGEVGTVTSEVNPEKQKRKLEKKLKQIDRLKERLEEGEELTSEEKEKISKLDGIKSDLESLKIH